ncbi:MAG TPA: restriction endonuclease subunit S [Chitinophagaceae bacterium]|nr:restriction endonuclease subunit S [Chitinophagaceae bacterium]
MSKAYEKYKVSGFEWMKEIPTSWDTASLNHVVKFIMGQAPHSDSYNTDGEGEIFIKTGDFGDLRPNIKWYTTKPLVFASEEDVFMCVVGATSGKVNLGVNGTISRSIAALRPSKRLSQKYLYYYLACNYQRLNDAAQGSAQGIINKTILAGIKVPLPSIKEQTKIAQYLDHQTSIIDQLILQKEKLIELLKEKKQAVINEAVTTGLNPNAKMKESSLEWLGAIPQAWNLVQIRHLNTKVGSGVTPKGGAEVYTEEGVIFIRSQNVHFDGLRLDDVVRIDLDTHEKMTGSKVQFKDVLLNITGASIGRCCVVDIHEEMNVNQHVCIIRPTQRVLPEYLNLVLQSNIGQVQIKLGTTGGNREGLTFEAIKEFTIPLPELTEQQEILHKVQSSLKRYYELENLNSIQINKLKEYCQSIIAEAVTGNIDVRDWQPNKKQVA